MFTLLKLDMFVFFSFFLEYFVFLVVVVMFLDVAFPVLVFIFRTRDVYLPLNHNTLKTLIERKGSICGPVSSTKYVFFFSDI